MNKSGISDNIFLGSVIKKFIKTHKKIVKYHMKDTIIPLIVADISNEQKYINEQIVEREY